MVGHPQCIYQFIRSQFIYHTGVAKSSGSILTSESTATLQDSSLTPTVSASQPLNYMPLPPTHPPTHHSPPTDDDSNTVTVKTETGEQLSARTTWTLLLYLTSSADGWYVPYLPYHNPLGCSLHHPQSRSQRPQTQTNPPVTASAAKQSSTRTTGAPPRKKSPSVSRRACYCCTSTGTIACW